MIRFILRFNLIWVGLTLLAYFAPYVRPSEFWLPMFLGLAYPCLVVGNVVFVGLWGFSRMKYWWISALTLLVGWNYLTAIFGLSFWEGRRSGDSLKIMTYNVNSLALESYKLKNNVPQGQADMDTFFRKQGADILCLQEFCPYEACIKWQLEKVPFLTTYPYHIRYEGNSVIIFSKYPIDSSGILPINKNGGNGCTFADILVGEKKMRVYSVHLQSNEVSGRADWVAEKGNLEERHTWATIGRMLVSVRRFAKIRSREADAVSEHVAASPYPVMVCGDFNDVPMSYTYYTMSKNLRDAFRERARGFGVTYAGNIPGLKIDYMLMDKKYRVITNSIFKVPYSDHYPSVVEVSLGE